MAALGAVAACSADNGLFAVLLEELFGLDGGHAAASGCGDGLAIAPVLHIATSINTVHAGVYVIVRFEIAVGVGVKLIAEHFRVWIVSDPEK